jgi:hypothetical protein
MIAALKGGEHICELSSLVSRASGLEWEYSQAAKSAQGQQKGKIIECSIA